MKLFLVITLLAFLVALIATTTVNTTDNTTIIISSDHNYQPAHYNLQAVRFFTIPYYLNFTSLRATFHRELEAYLYQSRNPAILVSINGPGWHAALQGPYTADRHEFLNRFMQVAVIIIGLQLLAIYCVRRYNGLFLVRTMCDLLMLVTCLMTLELVIISGEEILYRRAYENVRFMGAGGLA